jgi:hypothetical protein
MQFCSFAVLRFELHRAQKNPAKIGGVALSTYPIITSLVWLVLF